VVGAFDAGLVALGGVFFEGRHRDIDGVRSRPSETTVLTAELGGTEVAGEVSGQ
jgi:hypothetical protein